MTPDNQDASVVRDRLSGGPAERLGSPSHIGRAKTALYVITALYGGTGFFVGLLAALSADPLAMFLGLLTVSGALGMAVLGNTVLRLATRVLAIDESLADIHDRLDRIAPATEHSGINKTDESSKPTMDLAAIGSGDPGELAAARLDRDVLPRLVRMMEDEPPPEALEAQPPYGPPLKGGRQGGLTSAGVSAQNADGEKHRYDTGATAVTTRNLLRQWKLGLRSGDLAACRAVYAAFVDTVDPSTLAPLKVQLDKLADRTEKSLREAFSDAVGRRDYAGMLTVGEQICTLLRDRPVAEEFERIRPDLIRRHQHTTEDGSPTLRLAR